MVKLNDLINRDIPCVCGRTHRCDIPALLIGTDALDKLPVLLEPYKQILLVADQNTHPLAGDRIAALLKDSLESTLVFQTGDDLLVPDEASIAAIREKMTDKTDFILGLDTCLLCGFFLFCSFSSSLSFVTFEGC